MTTSALPGEAGQQLLEVGEHRRGQRGGVEAEPEHARRHAPSSPPARSRRANVLGRGLEAVDLLDDDARLLAILVVDPAADEHDRVGGERLLAGRERLAEHDQLDRSPEVVERREHHRVALLGPDPLGLGDHPADASPSRRRGGPRARRAGSRPRALQRRADLLERMGGDEQADRLLLGGQQLGAVELARRDRRVAGGGEAAGIGTAARPVRSAVMDVRPRSKIEPWPISASCWAFCPAPWACSSTASIPLREAPVEPNAPHLISASIAFLLTARLSTRAQKSHRSAERPVPPRGRA